MTAWTAVSNLSSPNIDAQAHDTIGARCQRHAKLAIGFVMKSYLVELGRYDSG